jgi:hypothetical protein
MLDRPIGILDEHPEWSRRLIAALEARRLQIDHSSHAFDPREREPHYAVIVNRTSPSSHTRGHGSVLFYAEAVLAHYEGLGVPVINPVRAYRFERSKALQLGLFERLHVRYPRALVVNHREQVLKTLDRIAFPLVVKPNVGGSGAGIVRFDSAEALRARLDTLDFGPDGTALVQEYVEPADGAIVRVEVLDGRALYAIRIVREAGAQEFNLCPADICQTPPPRAAADALGACPVDARGGFSVRRFDAPGDAVKTAIRLTRGAGIDVGGVEYLVGARDGLTYFYDVNATSNFVADAPRVLGFDPFPAFLDFIVATARNGNTLMPAP